MSIFIGFYIGSLSMILLYNLHWYRVTKERSYLLYSVFKFFMIAVILQNTKLLDIPLFFLIVSINVMFVLMLLFSKEFLELKRHFKKINGLLNAGLAFVLTCFIYFLYSGDYAIYSQSYSLLFSPLIVIGTFVYCKGFQPAKYYSIAWGLSLFLVGIHDLNEFKVIDFYGNIPFDYIGHILESIILSYAISLKTSLIVKEQEQTRKVLTHQARLASMGQMLENISHQWRQPLNRVSTSFINMQMHISKQDKGDKYLEEELNQSQYQLEYMSNTINDFTDFNKQDNEKEKFLASSIIDDVYKILGNSLENNNIDFEIIRNEDFLIFSYKSELSQVVLNLIQNAQDILLKRDVKQAHIRVEIVNGKISVKDNAGGIDSEIANHIYDPYFTTMNKASSLGLGLYMSKVILEKHLNASIELVQSESFTSFDINIRPHN